MLKLESRLPGFGGFYIDSLDRVVVYMKRSSGVPTTVVRQFLNAAYANRNEPSIRAIMAPAADAEVVDGAYSLSELIAVENRIAYPRYRIPGFVGVGVSLFLNRVKVGFRDSRSLVDGMRVITSMGVPEGILLPEVWGETKLAAYFKYTGATVRPTRGGIGIGMMNRTYAPWKWGAFDKDNPWYNWMQSGSLGYNVRSQGGTDYFLSAGHIANYWAGRNGATGDTVAQAPPQYYPNPINPIGRIVLNPAWDEGAACPIVDSTTMQHFDYCTTADVMLGSYFSGIGFERKVAVSDYEGHNGAPGHNHIRKLLEY